MQDETTAEHSEDAKPVPGDAADSTLESKGEEAAQEPEAVDSSSAVVDEAATPEAAEEPVPADDVETAEDKPAPESFAEAAAALKEKTPEPPPNATEAVELLASIVSEEPSASVLPEKPWSPSRRKGLRPPSPRKAARKKQRARTKRLTSVRCLSCRRRTMA